jgi:hypothetical protein
LKAIITIVLTLWSAAAFGSSADFSAGMIKGCRALAQGVLPTGEREYMDYGICLATLSSMNTVGQFLHTDLRSCPPREARPDQLAKVLLKFVEQNPEKLHHPPEILVIHAFRAGWPCR